MAPWGFDKESFEDSAMFMGARFEDFAVPVGPRFHLRRYRGLPITALYVKPLNQVAATELSGGA